MQTATHNLALITLLTLTTLPSPAPAATATNDIRRDNAVIAIENVMPSVVNIATEELVHHSDFYEEMFRRFYGVPQQKTVSVGSGVIIDEEGFILTNFHVVRRATRIQVKLWDGREYEADRHVATEASDVALIKIRAKPGEKFRAAKFAAPDDLLLGETVLALGNPFGLGGSVTKGILSSKNRRPTSADSPLNIEDWLQTDAAINPGNSGGPLVNLRGEIIGLNVAVMNEQAGARGMGVGFSIPVKEVFAALSHFFTPEVTDSLWLGARFTSAPGPLVVSSVIPGSPAQKAGLQTGDTINKINGQTPANLVELNRLLVAGTNRQNQIQLTRNQQPRTLKLQLLPVAELTRQKLGLTLADNDSPEAKRAALAPGLGLLVTAVDPASPADTAGIEKGMIISAINREPIPHLRFFGHRLSLTKPGDTVTLSVILTRRIGTRLVRHDVAVEVQTR